MAEQKQSEAGATKEAPDVETKDNQALKVLESNGETRPSDNDTQTVLEACCYLFCLDWVFNCFCGSAGKGGTAYYEEKPQKCLYEIKCRIYAFYNAAMTQFVIAGVIFLNFIVVLISVTNWALHNEDVEHLCETIDWGFVIFFAVEVVVNMAAHASAGNPGDSTDDFIVDWRIWMWSFWVGPNWAWNWFDFTVIAIPLMAATGWVSGIRVVRLARVVRLLKTVRKFDALLIVLNSVSRSLDGVGAVASLMLGVVTMYSIIGVQLFGLHNENNVSYKVLGHGWANEHCEATPLWKHFGNLRRAMLTMFQLVTVEGWPDLGWCLGKTYWYGSAFCTSFIICNALLMANIVVAIFTNQMEAAEEEVKAMIEKEKVASEARVAMARAISLGHNTIVQGIDLDGDGKADVFNVDLDGDGVMDVTLDEKQMKQVVSPRKDLSPRETTWEKGALIEVYSQTIKEWCPGKVLDVDMQNKKIRVEYDVNSNTLGEKTIPWNNSSIRRPASSPTEQPKIQWQATTSDLSNLGTLSPEALTTMLKSLTQRVETIASNVEHMMDTKATDL